MKSKVLIGTVASLTVVIGLTSTLLYSQSNDKEVQKKTESSQIQSETEQKHPKDEMKNDMAIQLEDEKNPINTVQEEQNIGDTSQVTVLPKTDLAEKVTLTQKAEPQKSVTQAPKAEQSQKVTQAPKNETQQKVTQAPKAEQSQKVAQAPKAEPQQKVQQAPKVQQQQKVAQAKPQAPAVTAPKQETKPQAPAAAPKQPSTPPKQETIKAPDPNDDYEAYLKSIGVNMNTQYENVNIHDENNPNVGKGDKPLFDD